MGWLVAYAFNPGIWGADHCEFKASLVSAFSHPPVTPPQLYGLLVDLYAFFHSPVIPPQLCSMLDREGFLISGGTTLLNRACIYLGLFFKHCHEYDKINFRKHLEQALPT